MTTQRLLETVLLLIIIAFVGVWGHAHSRDCKDQARIPMTTDDYVAGIPETAKP